MKHNGLPFFLVLTCLTFVNASDKPDANWPFLVFRKGETAHLPCLPQGDSNAFFWRKGPWFNISENVASVVHGIADTSEKYNVLDDGTLVIKDMTSEDEGKYYCRIASEKNECRGSVTVYLEALPGEVDISIEGCTSGSNCVKVLEPSSESQLVCTANMISESMTLKWYNGAKEIIGDLDVPETGRNGKISNVITFTFEEDSILTCKAEGANVEETTAVIQLRKKEESVSIENDDTSILLILAVVLGITCVILLGLLISSILCYRNLKKGQRRTKDTDNIETDTGTLDDTIRGQDTKEVSNTRSQSPKSQQEDTQEGKSEEKESLLDKNDTSSSTKDKEIQRLQEEVTKKDGDLKKKEEAVKSLETKLEETKKSLEKKDEELMTTSNELKKRENKLQAIPARALDKIQQTSNVETSLQTELTETKEALGKKNKELITTSNDSKKREDELKNSGREPQDIRETTATTENTEKGLQKKLQDTTEKLTTAKNANKKLQKEITKKNDDLKMREEELKSLQTELTETKEALGKKNKELITTSNDSKKREDELKGFQKKLQDTTEKLTTAENANKNLCAKIAGLKEGTVQYLTKTSIRVAIVLKPEKFRWEKSKLNALSSKYNTVCAVLSKTPSEDLTVMTEDIVQSAFDGANCCIVIYGNEGSGLVSTLHGDGKLKGLIEGISNQIVSELQNRKAEGFKVILKMCNKGGDINSTQLFNVEGQVVPNKQDRWENHTEYEVKTKEVTKLTSRMAPNESHLNRQGFIRFIIGTSVSSGKISGNLTVVSLIGVKHIPRFWTATQSVNAFEELLFPVLRNKDTISFLIGHCNPDQEDGVDEMCKATKQVLDKTIASKKAIAKQS